MNRARAAAAIAILVLVASGCSEGNVFSLDVGDCFDNPSSDSNIANVDVIDCTDPHDNEVVHIETLRGDDDDFPGAEAINAEAVESCLGEDVVDYVGAPLADSGLEVLSLTPTEESWQEGDREIVCFALSADREPLTESVEGRGGASGAVPDVGEPTDPPPTRDAEFARLQSACFDGDLAACDDLYLATPPGSAEEQYGSTCGGRVDEQLLGTCEATLS